ncbi:hydrogen gas-evolving membrane-bound hydrogenase subunit E [Sporosalibacterium faouarense]|uniref:hydrogen gas-evolving membrane-bound hydrogenase subunit E n=1 Tax=Sporosalibacterium faouarense TaxID=516123 RepID=UPI00141C056C|nr:hydrogen gas-evolving membrane-bound hydrogenase subunit E [Sporosalibacterium faouarense]MTI46920.1 hypothetical protein [Bacillota bacterium]
MRKILAITLTVLIIFILLLGVNELPQFGKSDNPANNYITKRYIEKGPQETGALNIVSAIILEYRAFDTFVEAIVLFTAIISVIIVLRNVGE